MNKSQLLNFFRVTLLLLIFSAFTTSAWAAATVTIYFDNTNTQWSNIYLYMGHGGYSRSDWQMTKVSGNIFKCDNVKYWDDATQIAFANVQWGAENNNLSHRLPYTGVKNYTTPSSINKDDATAYIYKPSLSNGVYSLTKEEYSGSGGSSTTYYLKGSFDDWGTGKTFSSGTCTINLSADTEYVFKINDSNNQWYGNTGTITGSIKEEGWTFDAEANCTLKTTIAGDYKFTWHEDTKKLYVTYPTESSGSSNVTTIYFQNTVGWSSVYAYLYNGSYWNDNDGSGSHGIKDGPIEMGPCDGIGGKDAIYSCTYSAGHSGYISFTEARQENFNNFNETKAAYRGDFGTSGNMFVPSTTPSGTYNGGKTTYYNNGNWETYDGECSGGTPLPDSKKEGCSTIEIYSKYDYRLYVFKNGNALGLGWEETQKGEKVVYKGSTYYKWTICKVDDVHIIFQDGDRNKQSGDSPKLYGGYAYFFDGQYVSDSRPVPKPTRFVEIVDCSTTGTCYITDYTVCEVEEINVSELQEGIVCDASNKKILFFEDFGTLSSEDSRKQNNKVDSEYSDYCGIDEFVTSYNYVSACAKIKQSGSYAIVANPRYSGCSKDNDDVVNTCGCNPANNRLWYKDCLDHTEGDVNGGMLQFDCRNGSYCDVLYQRTLSNVCENTFLNFSAWVKKANVSTDSNDKINALFLLRKGGGDGKIIGKKEVKEIDLNDNNLIDGWKQISAMFNTGILDNEGKKITVQLINLAPYGQNGNDILLDDLELAACTPNAELRIEGGGTNKELNYSESVILEAKITEGIIDPPYFYWQSRSKTQGSSWSEWLELHDKNGLPVSGVSSNKITVTPESPHTEYRVIIVPSINHKNNISMVLENLQNEIPCGMYAITNTVTLNVYVKDLILTPAISDGGICVDGVDETTLTFTVENTTDITVSNVKVKVNIPTEVTSVSVAEGSGYSNGVWTIGTIANNATAELKLTLKSATTLAVPSKDVTINSFISGINSLTYNTYEEKKIFLTLNQLPIASLENLDTNICNGNSSSLNINVSKGNPSYTINYKKGTTLNTETLDAAGQLNISDALTQNTIYTLESVQDSKGCAAVIDDNTKATVSVNPRPELLSFKIEDADIICAGTTTKLVAEFSGEAPFAFEINGQQYKTTEKGTYTEKDGNKTWTLELDNNVVNAAGKYKFTLTNLSDANCSSETLDNNEVTLEVEALPVIKDVPTEVELNCSQTTATIKASNASTYKWFYKDVDGVEQFLKDGSELSLSQTDVNIAELTTVYTVYGYSEKANCQSKEAKTVTVREDFVEPTLDVVALPSVCLPATVDIKEAIGSETKADELKYYSDESLTQELTNTNVQAAKDAKYYVVGYNDNGCKSQEEISINVTDVSGNVEVNNLYNGFCPTQTSSTVNLSELVISNKEGLKYYNKNSDGTYSEITTGEPSFDTSKEFASHTYYITNTKTGKCESTTPTPITVEIFKPVTATLSGTQTICEDQSADLTLTLTGNADYSITYKGGNPVEPVSGTSTTISVSPTSTTTYNIGDIISMVKDGNGCKATLSGSATVSVNPRPELLSFEIDDDDAIICAGTTTKLVAEFSGEAPFAFEINGQQYKTTEKGTYTEKDGNKTWTLELDNNVVNTAGTYQFTLTNLSDANCSSETLDNNKVTLEVEARPVINDVPTEVNLNCSQTTATIKASNASTYKWFYKDVDGVEQFYKDGSELSLSQTDVNIAERTTVYTVYGYSEKANCQSKEAKTVTVTEDFVVPTLEIVALTSVCLPATVDIKEAIGSETKVDELKYYSDNALTQELTNTNVQAAKDAKYYVVGYNDNGCKSQEEISINVTDVSDNVEVNNLYNGFCPTQTSSTVNLSELVTSNKEGLKYYNKNSDGTYSEITTGEPSFDTSKEFASHTYYITNTKTGKCESTTPTPITVEIFKPVTASISGISPLCSGETSNVTITLDGTPKFEVVYNNGTTDVPKPISGTTLSITESLTSTTTYKLVSVTDDNNCQAYLDGTEFVTVEVNSRPKLVSFEIEDTDDIICEGESTTLKATFTGTAPFYFKINGDDKTSHATEWSMTISDQKEYVITDLSDKNCSAETISNNSATLTVEETPVVTLSTTSAELDCNTEEITLTASGANTYSWTDNKGSAAQAVASIVAQQTGSETIYTVVGTSEHGCVSKDVSVTVTENFVNPTVTLKTKPQQDGSPMSTELNCRLKTIPVVADTENSPVEIVKYEWSNGGSVNEYNDLTAKGTYTVTVTGKNGCTASSTLEITENIVKPILSVEHIGSRTKETTTILNCNDQSVNITSSVSNVSAIGGSVEYFWYKDGDEYYYGETLEVFEDGTYKIVAVGTNNCESDFTVKLTKDDTKPKAEIVASAAMVTCSTPEVNLTVKTDVDCNYLWTGIVGEDAKKQTLKVEEGGTYTVFVQSNVNGCKTTLTHTLEQHTDLPTITIASSEGKVTCNPNTLTASGANEYVWNTGEKTESIVVTTGGTYTVTGTNEYGCETTKEIVLEENKLVPIISLTADTTHVTCRNEDVTLTVDITNAEATRSYTYKWLQGTVTSDVTVATFDAKEKATYKVIVTDQTNACFAEETIDVQENKQTPSIETKSLDAVCLPATVDIKDAITSTNAEEVKYFADKELIQELSTTEVEAAKDAKYYVVGYEVDNNGCATEPIEIAINVKPVSAVPTVTNYDECAVDGTKTLSSLVTSDKTNLVFFADATSEEPIADEFDASAANTSATYWVSNTEANSCESERAQITVDIAGYIDFTLEASETRVPAGEEITVTLTPLTDTPVEQYIWTRNDDVISDSDETTISEQIYLTSKYAVQAVGRCNSPKQEVDIEAVWPTAFTPYNGNGKNDDFARGMHIIVFNRFYTKIFEGPDGWDGTINGTMNESEQIAVPGVYYYSVQLPNGQVKKGTIEIIRVD